MTGLPNGIEKRKPPDLTQDTTVWTKRSNILCPWLQLWCVDSVGSNATAIDMPSNARAVDNPSNATAVDNLLNATSVDMWSNDKISLVCSSVSVSGDERNSCFVKIIVLFADIFTLPMEEPGLELSEHD